MEKDIDSQQFVPFSQWSIESAQSQLLAQAAPAGRYADPSPDRTMLLRIVHRVVGRVSEMFDPLFVVRSGGVPAPYQKVLAYLQGQKIAGAIRPLPLYNDEPWMYYCFLESPFVSDGTDGNKIRHTSYTFGASRNWGVAVSKVIGEFLERYPLLMYRTKDLIKASVRTLRRKRIAFVDPVELSVFSDQQKHDNFHLRFDETNHFYWVNARSLHSNTRVLLPAQTVFWNYNPVHREFFEPRLREFNTNGASGHFTLDEALLGGIYEIIQRDGFLIYWLNHQAPPQVSVADIEMYPDASMALKTLLRDCRRAGLLVHILNTTTPDIGIFACICVIVDHSDIGICTSIAGGCGTDVFGAIERSVEEALLVAHLSRTRKDAGAEFPFLDDNYIPFTDRSLNDLERINIFANPDMFPKFKFFLAGKYQPLAVALAHARTFESAKKELMYVKDIFARMGAGYAIYYYQSRHAALDALEYVSVKVVIPYMVCLYLRELNVPLGARRLREIPSILGFEPAERWNPWPHPFP